MMNVVRLVVRRMMRAGVRVSPRWIKDRVARVPFSRYHRLLPLALAGREVIVWRELLLEVNPGEIEGFFLFLLGVSRACSAVEIERAVGLSRAGGARMFLDVGANVGIMSLAVAAACPGLEVLAFEPDAGAAARFRRNLALNPELARRITLREEAVGDTDGTVRFFPSGDPGSPELGSLLKHDHAAATPATSARCTRLDSLDPLRQQRADVVKIDVEGAELQVLHGMSGLAPDHWPRVILLEVHGCFHPGHEVALYRSVHSLLTEREYDVFEVTDMGEVPCRRPEDWPARLHLMARRATDGAGRSGAPVG
jgi:FkbM family methyltransferase